MLALAALVLLRGAVAAEEATEGTPLPVGRKAPGPGEERSAAGTSNVHCTSTKGEFTIEMHPEWAPIGAERFLALVQDGAYDGTVIYRVVRRGKERAPEAVQFGFVRDEALRRKWREQPNLKDDTQIFSNPNFHRGMISFAGGGPNTRSTDVFITFMTGNANGTPRAPWETPFGIIGEEGLRTIGAFGGVGDLAMLGGDAPDLGKGYEALKTSHPNIDYLGKCTLVPAHSSPPTPSPTHLRDLGGLPRSSSSSSTSPNKLLSVGENHVMMPTTLGYWVLLGGVLVMASVAGCAVFGARYRLGMVRKVHGI
uniref:PPIase cyclophilin-type domain-containing protein n=1 Tax=Lotharella oceanica TaxID=641309 RepID=A0A7S2X6T1_9EUKA|mmetsp:Transcript_14952/g.28442  ORF Transcript_14952/g.28442 Transcript_14952/m.28442 type:complete len:310 (+) Transcript_14952:163-1092(+)